MARVDVRVVAATNRNLPELVAAGQFREDLLYRLRVIHLHVPPLRERPDDLRLLVAQFVQRVGQRAVRLPTRRSAALERYRWPGNVRELQNIVEQMVWLTEHDVIDVEQLPAGDPSRPGRC